MKILTSLIMFFLSEFCYGQAHDIVFVKVIKSEKDVAGVYDSLQTPLLIYQNKIYVIHSECITRDLGGNENSRNAGGNSADRNAGNNSNDRNTGGNTNDRSAGGNSNDRNGGGNANERNSGGDAASRNGGGNSNDRNAGGNSNDRNAGSNSGDRNAAGNSGNRNLEGAASKFTCSVDDKGKLMILFHNLEIDQSTRVYHNNSYLTTKSKFFKLKEI